VQPVGGGAEGNDAAPSLEMRPVDGVCGHARHSLPKPVDTILQISAAKLELRRRKNGARCGGLNNALERHRHDGRQANERWDGTHLEQ
jgi:hypothetical protein